MQQGRGEQSAWTGTALVMAGGLFGLVGLPVVFQSVPGSGIALLWLALALADAVGLLFAAPALFRALARYLRGTSAKITHQVAWTDRAAADLARLLVAAAYLVLAQAILRRPLVAVFGVDVEPFLIEAVVGAVALLVLLSLLGWAYAVARPLVEDVALNALDTAFVTAPEQPKVHIADSLSSAFTPTVVSTRRAASTDLPTEVASPPDSADATEVSRRTDPDATEVSSKRTEPDAIEVSSRRTDSDATELSR